MSRREFPDRVKVAAFQRAKGHCEKCTAKLFVGKIHYDHRIPDAMGGEPTLANCDVLCAACHGVKTARVDVPAIAKVKRTKIKHVVGRGRSTFPKPPPGYDPWRRRMKAEGI